MLESVSPCHKFDNKLRTNTHKNVSSEERFKFTTLNIAQGTNIFQIINERELSADDVTTICENRLGSDIENKH